MRGIGTNTSNYYQEARRFICARPVDALHARPAARRSRMGYASAAASHPINALARRNRGVPSRKGP
jgi:hypothetical protein